LPRQIRAAFIAILTVASSMLAVAPVAAAVPLKVVIIVGPTGALTDNYRDKGDTIAATAQAAGATVVKVYSPTATWANVKAAVNGANIVVYLGHGNGFPSPYSSTENTDRVNGWGLNRTTTAGDSDNWSTTMVYCGEKALRGTLTSSDGAAQRTYCSGGPITPAPHWVMVYSNACYAPGAGEGFDVKATESVAFQRVRNYSYPALSLGASAYFASDLGADGLVDMILRNRSLTFTDIARATNGYDNSAQRHFAHPDVANAEVWLQRTSRGGDNFDYWLGFAGNPFATPEGGIGVPLPYAPVVVSRYPSSGATNVSLTSAVAARFDMGVTGVSGSSFVLRDSHGTLVPSTVTYRSDQFRAQLVPAAPLAYGTRYTATLGSAIKNSGNLSLSPVSWSFTTPLDPAAGGTEPPRVLSLTPSSGTTGVSMSPALSVRFSEAMTGVSASYLVLRVEATSSAVAATVSYDPATFTATLRPKLPLLPNTKYRVVFGSAITDLGGNGLGYVSWTFKTRSTEAYDPALTLRFSAGTYTGYRFSSSGAVLSTKPATLTRASNAPASSRSAIAGQTGGWYYIAAGIWAGYWVKDATGIAPL